MKRFILFITLLFVLSSVLISGCSKQQTRNAFKENRTSIQPSENGKIKLNLMFYHEGENRFQMMSKLCQGFNEKQNEIEVVPVFVPFKDYKKKLILGYSDGNMPDMVILDNPDNAYFADIGLLADITDRLGDWPDKKQYFKGPLMSCTYKGRIFGIPVGNNCLALFYNKKLLEKASVKAPETWDDLRAAARELTKSDVKGIGISAIDSEEGTFQFLPWMLSAGGSIEKLDSPETIKALTFLSNLVADGSMSKDVINWSQYDVMKQFIYGKIAMMVNGSWQLSELKVKGAGIDYGVVKLPKDKVFSSVLGGENLAVIKGKSEEEALQFLLYVSKPENIKSYLDNIGYFPPRKDIDFNQTLGSEAVLQVFEEEMHYASPRGPHPKWPVISGVISKCLQEALLGTEAPADAAYKAQLKLDELLKE